MTCLHSGKAQIKSIGLIASVAIEGERITSLLKRARTGTPAQPEFFTGRIEEKDIACAISGIGKTNASHAATLLIQRYTPSCIINFGVGGAYPSSGLNIGDIAVADKEIYGDEGVLDRNGFHGTDFIGIPVLKKDRESFFNVFKFDSKLVKKALQSGRTGARRAGLDIDVKSGTFVTVSTCSGTRRRALELQSRFDALCENMEGAAVAHICTLYGIPVIEIRGISNAVEDRDTRNWDIKLASENCQNLLIWLMSAL